MQLCTPRASTYLGRFVDEPVSNIEVAACSRSCFIFLHFSPVPQTHGNTTLPFFVLVLCCNRCNLYRTLISHPPHPFPSHGLHFQALHGPRSSSLPASAQALLEAGLLKHASRLRLGAGGVCFIAFVTAVSGAFVAGNDAGRCYNTFPKMTDDHWLPEEVRRCLLAGNLKIGVGRPRGGWVGKGWHMLDIYN